LAQESRRKSHSLCPSWIALSRLPRLAEWTQHPPPWSFAGKGWRSVKKRLQFCFPGDRYSALETDLFAVVVGLDASDRVQISVVPITSARRWIAPEKPQLNLWQVNLAGSDDVPNQLG